MSINEETAAELAVRVIEAVAKAHNAAEAREAIEALTGALPACCQTEDHAECRSYCPCEEQP